jgi:hypothetical protein
MATSTFSIAELKLDTTVRGLALARLSSVSKDDSAAVAAAGVASFIVRVLASLITHNLLTLKRLYSKIFPARNR